MGPGKYDPWQDTEAEGATQPSGTLARRDFMSDGYAPEQQHSLFAKIVHFHPLHLI